MNVKPIFYFFFLLAANPIKGAEIQVQDWTLTTLIRLAGIGENGEGSGDPTNPFQATHTAQRSNSTATSSILAEWDATGHLDFHLEAEQHCQGTGGGQANINFCRSSGTIYFTPQMESLFSVDLELNYNQAAGDRDALISLLAFDITANEHVYLFSNRRHTLTGQYIGQMTYAPDPALLTPDHQYVVLYTLSLEVFSGSPDDLSHADGHFSMQIAPIPEPATLAILSVAGPLIVRRRRRTIMG